MVMFLGPRNIGFKEFVKNHLYNSADSNTKISLTIALGFLTSTLPVWGFQSILALSLAFVFRLNKIIIFAVSNISQPPITPVIIFLSYLLGGMIIDNGNADISYSSGFSLDIVKDHFYQYAIGSIVLAITVAVAAGMVTYCLLFFLRKKKEQVAHDKERMLCM